MLRITEGSTRGLPEVEAFIRDLGEHGLFDRSGEVVVARAPGRLDVMGGIADYSGSLVLQLPIREATLAAVQRTASDELRLLSTGSDEHRSSTFVMPMSALSEAPTYEAAREYFA